jgi:hypothetical protein
MKEMSAAERRKGNAKKLTNNRERQSMVKKKYLRRVVESCVQCL